ncbi:hypothetical protein U1Q18_034918, partial [Sarracenia purpurea var. burkii]
MGISSSSEAKSAATVKLIFLDGGLQEFSSPMKVSHVLQKKNPPWFVCNSDEMDFDDFLSAIDDDEELQPGHLYFALPLSWLARPLQAADMASLAVKASLALARTGGGEKYCGCCSGWPGSPAIFSDEENVESRRKVVSGGCGGGVVGKESARSCGKGRKKTRKLSMILELGN